MEKILNSNPQPWNHDLKDSSTIIKKVYKDFQNADLTNRCSVKLKTNRINTFISAYEIKYPISPGIYWVKSPKHIT